MLKDAEGAALAPIPFGGVYLPLEVPPSHCHRTPLLLAYHSAHFSPLVTVDAATDFGESCSEGVSIPLVDPDTGQLLPVLFAVDRSWTRLGLAGRFSRFVAMSAGHGNYFFHKSNYLCGTYLNLITEHLYLDGNFITGILGL